MWKLSLVRSQLGAKQHLESNVYVQHIISYLDSILFVKAYVEFVKSTTIMTLQSHYYELATQSRTNANISCTIGWAHTHIKITAMICGLFCTNKCANKFSTRSATSLYGYYVYFLPCTPSLKRRNSAMNCNDNVRNISTYITYTYTVFV